MGKVHKLPVIAATAFAALFLSLFFYASVARVRSSSPGPLDRTRFMADQEEKIRAGLTDPESARFRNEAISTNRDGATLCGRVNFKNSMGGYEGFERFISGQSTTLFERAMSPSKMNDNWNKLCGHER
jgi:hypothetical protein